MWLELCELDWCEAFEECDSFFLKEDGADSAAAGAASGAPEGREKKTAHATRGPETNVSLTDSNSPSSREASESDESESDESASSGTDLEDEDSSWHSSSQKQKQRQEGILALLAALKREGCPVPNPSEFQSGLLRFFSGEKKCKGERFDVARALGAQKQHFFLGKLEEKFKGESFHHRSQRFFCEGFPSLAPPAPGGDQIVEFVSCRHPMWEALRRGRGVNTIPDFLKHLCSQHDGEVRLLSAAWAPAACDVDVRHPAFWTPQFVKEGASRRWLAERKNPRKLLDSHDVRWLFEENDGETTVLKKYTAASGAPRFAIRHGTAVTLAQMYYHGEESRAALDIYKLYMDLPILVHKARHDSDKGIGRKRRRAR